MNQLRSLLPSWRRYLLPLLIIAIASLIRAVFFGGLGRGTAYLTYYPAVMLAALSGGLIGGLLGTTISAFLCFFWVQQGFMSPIETMAFLVFILSSIMISLIAETMRRAQIRVSQLNISLEKQTILLHLTNEQLQSRIDERRDIEVELRQRLERAEGSERAMISVLEDQKRAEDALRESEERYQNFIAHSFEAIYRTEFDHPIDITLPLETQIDQIYENAYMAECNQALADMYSLPSVEALIGSRLVDAHGGKDNPVNRAAFRKFIENGYKSFDDETIEFDSAGNPIWFLSNTVGLVESGCLIRLWGTSLDVTERKRAEAEMENMARFPAENPNPVLRVNQDGILLYANETGISYLPDWHLVIGEPVPQALHQAMTEAMSGHFKEWVDTVQGGRVISFSVTPIIEAGYANFYGRDVTRSRQAEAERERLLVELERKNKELESMIYLASHDLRSPLVNIQGFGGHLQKYFEQVLGLLKNARSLDELRSAAEPILAERIPKALRFVETGSAKMDILINGLLRLSRIGRACFQMKTVDMNSLVQNVLDAMAFQIKKSGAHIQWESPLAECYGDENQLSQVFSNLLDNAVKYRAPARPLTITISSEIKERKADYSIADTGLGIAPEHQDKIWEIFRRFEEDTAISGEGLGLTIARRIIEYHNGRIWVESKPGVGSCFHIELPLEES